MKKLILALAFFASPAIAQTTQFSNITQSEITGDHSGLGFLFDFSQWPQVRGELLLCEGGCSRHKLTNIKMDDRGFTATVNYGGAPSAFRGSVNGNRVTILDTVNPGLIRVLYRCNKSTPINIKKCGNYSDYRLR
jgi:hypothetical protein